MTAEELIDVQLETLRKLKAGWELMLGRLYLPRPSGLLFVDGSWETTEEAIIRVQGWITREAVRIRFLEELRDVRR